MGGTSSRHGGQVINTAPNVQAAPPEPPYPGPCAQYQFVNLNVTMTTQYNYNSFRGQMTCSNVDSYYPALADQYRHGFRMLTFYHIPGQVQHAGGLFNPAVLMPYQGIFCRYPTLPPSSDQYQLHIEKSVIQPQIVWNGFLTTNSQLVTDTNHLFQTIATNAAKGGRLICIELTGQEAQQQNFGMQRQMPMLGCDLFFEMPITPPQETYIYNIVSQPIHVSVQAGFPAPKPIVQCNWSAILQANLGQGWKLVEIFMDEAKTAQTRGFSAQMSLNSQWYFEKPASRVNNPTPVYQGTVVEFEIVMKQSFGGVKATANWEPVLQDMGNKGWELACFLETPDQRMSGFGKITMKVLLFFQRKLVPDTAGYAMQHPQPPPVAMPDKAGYPPQPAAQGPPYPPQPAAQGPPYPPQTGAAAPPPPYYSVDPSTNPGPPPQS